MGSHFGTGIIACMRIGIEIHLFIICISNSFDRFFVYPGLGDSGIEEFANGRSLSSTEF